MLLLIVLCQYREYREAKNLYLSQNIKLYMNISILNLYFLSMQVNYFSKQMLFELQTLKEKCQQIAPQFPIFFLSLKYEILSGRKYTKINETKRNCTEDHKYIENGKVH